MSQTVELLGAIAVFFGGIAVLDLVVRAGLILRRLPGMAPRACMD